MERNSLKSTKRLVVKVGTKSIMLNKSQINLRKIDRIAYVLSALIQEGIEVILVTSGAIGVGASLMNLEEYPQNIPDQQALSAIGQTHLMTLYAQSFRNYSQHIGQILFTKDIVEFPTSRKNMHNEINRLLEKKIIPIINENDAVSVDELNHSTRFGDNDTLSAVVAVEIDADLLVILSDVDGLYDKNPSLNIDARLIEYVPAITEDIKNMAQGKGFEFSKGGMGTKLNAAEIILNAGSSMVIASAEIPDVIFSILEGKQIGTLFSKIERANSYDNH